MKQFLGLVGYYCKFIPRFSDIARPLNALTSKGHEFLWDIVSEQSFQMLKQMLIQEPILVYPDPSKPYVLFTDASKYAWSCVLTQEYVYIVSLASSLAATASTNIMNAALTIVHIDLLCIFTKVHQQIKQCQ